MLRISLLFVMSLFIGCPAYADNHDLSGVTVPIEKFQLVIKL
jgi:hypothetical protein